MARRSGFIDGEAINACRYYERKIDAAHRAASERRIAEARRLATA